MTVPMCLREVLLKYRPHRGLATESLLTKMAAAPQGTNPLELELTDEERRTLARVLVDEPGPPSQREVEGAVELLLCDILRSHERRLTRMIATAEEGGDSQAVKDLLLAKQLVRRARQRLEGADDGL